MDSELVQTLKQMFSVFKKRAIEYEAWKPTVPFYVMSEKLFELLTSDDTSPEIKSKILEQTYQGERPSE